MCAGPGCREPLIRAATGRPAVYCGQACRQAALRRRRLREAAPALRAEARDLLGALGAASGVPESTYEEHLGRLGAEDLDDLIRHARAARAGLDGVRGILGRGRPPARPAPAASWSGLFKEPPATRNA
ncbi:hypothetical protein KSE_76230t [Kitasatospora setae KM-6054]|uniref:Uncharacterized protein n=1 Tax=Kitasatospora setae (strain ATCC 33774 / DSM 43861 / JCM 3304 / KCC A-0304 / NBRC 14216 / KM-6054) TaxID=452652 RepID=E4MZ10_KITSK|nr:hypothetical protein KSE_00510t [Kitasatospora setae KM-6054]BAJ33375.1 hypothetical protein KSE_76230t [Kitasatospora setae KM-6054]